MEEAPNWTYFSSLTMLEGGYGTESTARITEYLTGSELVPHLEGMLH